MLIKLIPQIVDDVRNVTDGGPMAPIEQTPRPEVALPAGEEVGVLPAGDAAEDDGRGQDRVAGVDEDLLDRDEREQQRKGQHVRAQQQRRQVQRQPAAEEPGERVVEVGGEGVGRRQGVLPGLVQVGDGGVGRVQDEAVDVVLEGLFARQRGWGTKRLVSSSLLEGVWMT